MTEEDKVRINVIVYSKLKQDIKLLAAEQDRSMTSLVEEILANYVHEQKKEDNK